MGMDKSQLFRRRGVAASAEIDGQTFHFKPITAEDRLQLVEARGGGEEGGALSAEQQLAISLRLVIVSTCNENGEPAFDETDVPNLRKLPAPVLDALTREAMKVNAMGVQAEAASGN